PTLALKAAVLGRKFQIRWGGATDLIYTEDVARALLAALHSPLVGARVYNLHGASAAIADVVRLLDGSWPSARGLLAHVGPAIAVPSELDDARCQRELGPHRALGLAEGGGKTLEEFARLEKDGRLDARELG